MLLCVLVLLLPCLCYRVVHKKMYFFWGLLEDMSVICLWCLYGYMSLGLLNKIFVFDDLNLLTNYFPFPRLIDHHFYKILCYNCNWGSNNP